VAAASWAGSNVDAYFGGRRTAHRSVVAIIITQSATKPLEAVPDICDIAGMTFDEIRHTLETTDRVPDEALRAALGHADALVPLINELISKFKSGTVLMPAQQNLLHYGLHVLAAARRHEVWPAWLELLGEDEDDLDELFGDHLLTVITDITLGLVDEDVEPILSLIAGDDISPGIKWSLFQVLAWLTWKGRVPIEQTRALLRRFLDAPLADDDDAAWEGWQDCVVLLGLTDTPRFAGLHQSTQGSRSPRFAGLHRSTDPVRFCLVEPPPPALVVVERPPGKGSWRTASSLHAIPRRVGEALQFRSRMDVASHWCHCIW